MFLHLSELFQYLFLIDYYSALKLNLNYSRILGISVPIMLASAAQNLITVTDSLFLSRKSEVDFAAVGMVSIFYLIVAAIGYGFSKGGQILMSHRKGAFKYKDVGNTFWNLVYFELVMAIIMYLVMVFAGGAILRLFVQDEVIVTKCLEYLDYRSWGVFFSYLGVSIVALYTGLAKTTFIIIDVLILAFVNLILNYVLIFGKFGFEPMGIGGAGLASSISEVVAFLAFVIYMIFDKSILKYNVKKLSWPVLNLVKAQIQLGAPIVAQVVVGLGSWFVLTGIIENLGTRQLAISNVVRMVYLFLSIPCWGFSSAINTIVSYYVGRNEKDKVMPAIWKTVKISFVFTFILGLPFILFPEFMLGGVLGPKNYEIIIQSKNVLYVLGVILMLFSVVAIYFNGLAGTGATLVGLVIQTMAVVIYLSLIYIFVNYVHLGIEWAWGAEIIYWIIMQIPIYFYLKKGSWDRLTF